MTKDTIVVNVHVANIRPKYDNLKEWISNRNHVYIGHRGVVFIDHHRFPKTQLNYWTNPFLIDRSIDPNGSNRNEVMKKYKKYITKKIIDENLYKELAKLKGKTLGCWCKPLKCHGDVLVSLIEKLNDTNTGFI